MIAIAILPRPAVALGAILCTYGLEQWAQSRNEFFFAHQSLTNFATGSLLLWALLIKFLRGDGALGQHPRVSWVVLALFTFSLLSILWSVYRGGSIEHWAKHWPYIVTIIILSPLVITGPDDLRTGFLATLALGSVILLLLMLDTQWVGRQIVLSRGVMVGSVISRYGNPLAVASLAGYALLIALLMNFRGAARFWQIARWGVIVLGLAVSIRSGSRGQLFALLVAALAFLPLSRRLTNQKGFFATALALTLLLFLANWAFEQYGAGERRWQLDSMIDAYGGGRIGTSIRLLEYWLGSGPHYWLIGLGTSASFHPRILGFYPHVVLIEVLAEEGLIGFVLLWAVVILTGQAIYRTYQHVWSDPERRGLLSAAGALFLFEVVLSFKQGSLLGSPYAFAFAIILGRYELAIRREAVDAQYTEESLPLTQEQYLYAAQ